MGNKLLYLLAGGFVYLLVYASCANIGMPTGGPKDTIPPVMIKSIPSLNAVNVSEKSVRVYFDEYVISEGFNDKFIVSPPIEKQPVFKTKGKSVIIDFSDKLADSTTYSLDFKDAIVDNNEKNPLKNFRFAFSTGPFLDSLRIVGFVKDAFNLEPVEGAYILLYRGLSDTLVYTSKPDFVAKTAANGLFALTNLPVDTFQIYSLTDNNRDLIFQEGAEPVAFIDSTIAPYAIYQPDRDTIRRGVDTLVVFGKTRFYPDPIYLLQFEEYFFSLRIDDYQRPERERIDIIFSESAADTFNFELINYEAEDGWYVMEATPDIDTATIWITDSLVYMKDTLVFKFNYIQQDSLGEFYTINDTLRFFYSDKTKAVKKRGKRTRKLDEKPINFRLKHNASSGFDIYNVLTIEAPVPVKSIDTSMVKLYIKEDTLYNPLEFDFEQSPDNIRKFYIKHDWQFEASYKLEADSAAFFSIYDLPSFGVKAEFKIRPKEYYGSVVFDIKNVEGPIILQLLREGKKEEVVWMKRVYQDGIINFPYLNPQKYLAKIIFDRNDNGKWDTGNLREKLQPEEVIYYPKVIKARQNWEQKPVWELPVIKEFQKDIIDEEEEEKKRKEAMQKG